MKVPNRRHVIATDLLADVTPGVTFALTESQPQFHGEVFLGVSDAGPETPPEQANFIPCSRLRDGRLFAFPKDWPCQIIELVLEPEVLQ